MKPLSVVKNCFNYLSYVSKKLFQKPQQTSIQTTSQQSKNEANIKTANNQKSGPVPIKLIKLQKGNIHQTKTTPQTLKKLPQKVTNTLKMQPKEQKLNALKIGFNNQNFKTKSSKQPEIIKRRSSQPCQKLSSTKNIYPNRTNQNWQHKNRQELPNARSKQVVNQQLPKQNRKLSKKQKKLEKKENKMFLSQAKAEQVAIYFMKYQDGSDISSIAEKSQTRSQTGDELQTEFIGFLQDTDKNLCFDENNDKKQINVKKKKGFQQGTTTKKNKMQNFKKQQSDSESQKQIKPKKRAICLYPGETLEQLKKRILLSYAQSSQCQSSMRQQSYVHVLSGSVVAMQEQNEGQILDKKQKVLQEGQSKEDQEFMAQIFRRQNQY